MQEIGSGQLPQSPGRPPKRRSECNQQKLTMKSNPIATPTLAQYVSENIDTGIVQEFEVSVNLSTKHITFLLYMYNLFCVASD